MAPTAFSRALSPCMPRLRRLRPTPSHLLARISSHIVCPLFISTRQQVSAFNQPLSFDTSSVTNMHYMFSVRSSPCPARISSPALPCMLPAPRSPATSRLQARTSPRIVCPLFISTWQQAVAFNQPLSFDTSSVTTMESMFSVLPARALAPGLQLGPPRARRLRHTVARTPSPPPDPHLTPLRMPCI